jgi:hypothetical protein
MKVGLKEEFESSFEQDENLENHYTNNYVSFCNI